MTSIKDLEKKLKQPANLLLAKASSLGFTGSLTDELPQEIASAIANGGAKKLNAAPPKASEPGNGNEATQENGPDNVHAAFFASTTNLQTQHQETELIAAEVAGKLQANRIYMHYCGGKNSELMMLFGRDADNTVSQYQQTLQDYQLDLSEREHEAIANYAQSDKTGKTLKQAQQEMRALLAGFKK